MNFLQFRIIIIIYNNINKVFVGAFKILSALLVNGKLYFSINLQLVDLLLNADWSTYFADHGTTTSKYSRVNPQVVAKLLEK